MRASPSKGNSSLQGHPVAIPSRLPILGGAPAAPPRQLLPLTELLEDLWDEISSRRFFGGGLRRYLALARRTRLRLVDENRVRIIAPSGKINDCRNCRDICCVGPSATVLLRCKDIATLIDIDRGELISQQKPAFPPAALAPRPALRRQISSRGWKVFPVLAKNNMGACAALTREGRCSLYPNWPLACARFPYALHSNLKEAFFSQSCDSFWVRSDATPPVREMVTAAVAAYNERIKDLVLLEYVPERLAELGLMRYLRLG